MYVAVLTVYRIAKSERNSRYVDLVFLKAFESLQNDGLDVDSGGRSSGQLGG